MVERLFTDRALQDAYRALMQADAAAGHVDEATWDRIVTNQIEPDARDRVFDHVLECDACARVWRGVLALRADAEAQGLIAPSAAATKWQWIRSPLAGLALAASLILIVGVVVTRPQRDPVPEPAPSPPAPAGSSGIPASFPVTKADIHVLPEDALAPRGTETRREPPVERLAEALAPYRRDDYATAAQQLGALYAQYPQSARTALYLGVSLLMVGRPAEALVPLQTAAAAPQAPIAADGRWYHAVALARVGRADEARREASDLCAAGGPNSERACAAGGGLRR